MKKALINQSGSTLTITLLIITLLLLFSSVSIAYSLSTRTQLNKTETDMQATDLAEMGIQYFEKSIIYLLENNSVETAEELKEFFYSNLSEGVREVSPENSFKIENIGVTGPVKQDNKKIISISMSSTGIHDPSDTIKKLTNVYKVNIPFGEADEVDFDQLNDRSYYEFPFPDADEFTNVNLNELGNSCLDSPLNSWFNGDNLAKHCTHLISGYAFFEDALFVDKSTLQIGESAKFNNSVEFQNNSIIDIDGNAEFKQHADLQQGSELSIDGNAIFNSAQVSNNVDFIVDGNTYFGNDVQFANNSDTKFKGNVRFSTATFKQNSSLTISKNTLATNNLTIEENAEITIDGSAKFTAFSIDKNATLTVKGDFYSDNWLTVNGKVCIHGRADLGSNQSVINANSCEGQPNGTIYVLNEEVEGEGNPGTDQVQDGTLESGEVKYNGN